MIFCELYSYEMRKGSQEKVDTKKQFGILVIDLIRQSELMKGLKCEADLFGKTSDFVCLRTEINQTASN